LPSRGPEIYLEIPAHAYEDEMPPLANRHPVPAGGLNQSQKSRRFAVAIAVAFVVLFAAAVAIIEYGNASTVNLDITGSTHAYFVVEHGSANVTVPEDQNAVVQVPQHANITVYAYPDAPYTVSGWSVSTPTTAMGQNYVEFVTGSDGSTIRLSVTISTT